MRKFLFNVHVYLALIAAPSSLFGSASAIMAFETESGSSAPRQAFLRDAAGPAAARELGCAKAFPGERSRATSFRVRLISQRSGHEGGPRGRAHTPEKCWACVPGDGTFLVGCTSCTCG